MKIGKLREQLNDLIRCNGDDILDLEVYAVSDYGDRCHTQQLVELGDLGVSGSKETAYSDSGLALDEDGDGKKGAVFSDDIGYL